MEKQDDKLDNFIVNLGYGVAAMGCAAWAVPVIIPLAMLFGHLIAGQFGMYVGLVFGVVLTYSIIQETISKAKEQMRDELRKKRQSEEKEV